MMEKIATENVLVNGNRIAHGIHGSVPRLVKAGYKVHVYDLLGYGHSERPWDPSVDTSITGQVPILKGLLKHWGLETTHIVAHDIGGAIAQRFAVFSPKRVRSLTMVDTVSFDSYPSARTKQQMQNGLESLIKAPDEDHLARFTEWLLTTVQNPKQLVDSSLETYLEYISGPIGQGSLFQHQVRHYDPKHTMEIADRIHELGKLPVKLIWGADDAWQVVDWAHRLNREIPGSELDIMENCGHFAPEDQPEKLSDLVIAFLEQHP